MFSKGMSLISKDVLFVVVCFQSATGNDTNETETWSNTSNQSTDIATTTTISDEFATNPGATTPPTTDRVNFISPSSSKTTDVITDSNSLTGFDSGATDNIVLTTSSTLMISSSKMIKTSNVKLTTGRIVEHTKHTTMTTDPPTLSQRATKKSQVADLSFTDSRGLRSEAKKFTPVEVLTTEEGVVTSQTKQLASVIRVEGPTTKKPGVTSKPRQLTPVQILVTKERGSTSETKLFSSTEILKTKETSWVENENNLSELYLDLNLNKFIVF